MKILKFGGTSVGDAERIGDVVAIVRRARKDADCVVVVSAMAGVTRTLSQAAELAASGDASYSTLVSGVIDRHRDAAKALCRKEDLAEALGALTTWSRNLEDRLHGVSLVRECTPRTLDSVMAFGELASSTLVAAALRKAGVEASPCDARRLLVTDGAFGRARVDMDASGERARAHFSGETPLQVVTGFIAATPAGETTTLGRGGSDYTASLLGALLNAGSVEIWTDVDGVMSADPRLVPQAFSLPSLTYDELLELSHFGAKVVFPPSVHPARERGIPLLIRNTLHPDFPGTRIAPGRPATDNRPIRGISSIPHVALLRLEGDGMVGVPGTVERLFRALARAGVSVILISQASSEHSICFAVDPSSLEVARAGVENEFRLERRTGLLDELVVEPDCAVIAVVGEGMRDTPGIAGRVFSILGREGINVRAIAQGSSELNISLVVASEDAGHAVRTLHGAVVAPRGSGSPARVYLAGLGGVGGALLRYLTALGAEVPSLELAGVATSTRLLADPAALVPSEAEGELARRGCPGGGAELARAAMADPAGLRLFVDCSASDELGATYPELLKEGVYVVAANNRGFSGPLDAYRRARTRGHVRAYLEATVGAGLPVLRTLEELRASGDRILSVKGVLSGALAFLFDQIMAGRSFSDVVVELPGLGYTEPDPRDDLSGKDVLRKLVILAREAGVALESEDVALEPVLPGEDWEALGVADFLARLPSVNEHFAKLRARALTAGARLCYLASLADGKATVELVPVGPDHPCHGLRGTDNLVAITTERYTSPLTIRGPGAGLDVTAGGVLADILRCMSEARGWP